MRTQSIKLKNYAVTTLKDIYGMDTIQIPNNYKVTGMGIPKGEVEFIPTPSEAVIMGAQITYTTQGIPVKCNQSITNYFYFENSPRLLVEKVDFPCQCPYEFGYKYDGRTHCVWCGGRIE